MCSCLHFDFEEVLCYYDVMMGGGKFSFYVNGFLSNATCWLKD